MIVMLDGFARKEPGCVPCWGIFLKPTWTYRSFLKKPHENRSLAMANAGHVTKRSWRKKLSRTLNIRQRLLSQQSKCCHREICANVSAEPPERAWMRRGEKRRAGCDVFRGGLTTRDDTSQNVHLSLFNITQPNLVKKNSGVKSSKGGNSFYYYYICLHLYYCSLKQFLYHDDKPSFSYDYNSLK